MIHFTLRLRSTASLDASLERDRAHVKHAVEELKPPHELLKKID